MVERSTDGGTTFSQIAAPGARTGTGTVSFTDTNVTLGSTYVYRVAAENAGGTSAFTPALTAHRRRPGTPDRRGRHGCPAGQR